MDNYINIRRFKLSYQDESSPTDGVTEVALDERDIKNRIMSLGVNSVISSYNSTDKKVATDFLSLPLDTISDTWPYLCDTAKVTLINLHEDSFLRWVKSE